MSTLNRVRYATFPKLPRDLLVWAVVLLVRLAYGEKHQNGPDSRSRLGTLTVVACQVSLNLRANTDTVSDLDRLDILSNSDSLE